MPTRIINVDQVIIKTAYGTTVLWTHHADMIAAHIMEVENENS